MYNNVPRSTHVKEGMYDNITVEAMLGHPHPILLLAHWTH